MGRFINKGNQDFADVRKSEYVDKSPLIHTVNGTLSTERKCSCVSRCRRFGKSMAAKMLYAYYDKSCDSRHLFEDLAIAKLPSFEEHLNKYPTIYLDMTYFTTAYPNNPDIVSIIQQTIKEEICSTYPDIPIRESYDLMDSLFEVADHTGERFMFIIDEWDAICREYENLPGAMDTYVNLLRRMFKGGNTAQVFVGVYMTGILPIKKYKTESALNNFWEYSMIDPEPMEKSFGFTKEDVQSLCAKYGMDYAELAQWYDGYKIGDENEIFNPYSVMKALGKHKCGSYFISTGAYDAVSAYIQMNFDGLKDDIINMLAGGRCGVNPAGFGNDPNIIKSKDDVLTVLIHLGYLAYDRSQRECFVPNMEVREVLELAVMDTSWTKIVKTIEASRKLLSDTINCNEEAVAQAIDRAHDENTSILSYNDENSLSCVLSIAYLWAKNEYIIHRELATGKGFADLVMIPRKNVDKPAMVIELKFNTAADTAIEQIHQKQYPQKVADYTGDLLLCGINYDKETKTHSCKIEEWRI